MDIQAFIKQTWQFLVEPTDEVTESTDRRRAKLFSALSLCLLIGLLPTLFGTPEATGVSSVMPFWVMFSGFLAAYFLSRTRYFQWGIWELVVVLCLMPVVFSVNDLDYVHSNLTITVVWMVTPLMVGSMVLPKKPATLLLIAGPILISSLIFFIPPVTFVNLFPSLFFVIVWGVLQIVFLRHTEGLELDRRAELKDTADQLKDVNLALQGEVIKRANAEQVLAQQAEELKRSNAMIAALGEVAAHITATSDSNEIFEILGTELKSLGVDVFISLKSPGEDHLIGQYVSIDSAVIDVMQKMVGLNMESLSIPTDSWPVSEVLTHKQGVFFENVYAVAKVWMPAVPELVIKQILKMVGVSPDTKMFYLPLSVGDELLGLMAMWGMVISENDLKTLSVFANQVAAALENGRLHTQTVASLKEKDVLLKEVHHRVKNNMQVVSSLLNLQTGMNDDGHVNEILLDSQNRVRSMALIHETLYRSENMAWIDFSEYIQVLTNHLVRANRDLQSRITLDIQVQDVYLGIDAAVPCGLIINELVSNSLKHAFPESRRGEIRITFHCLDDNRLELRVGDDGIGFSSNVYFRETTSLGLQLVNTLVEQLDGNIELNEEGNGAEFRIVFEV